MYFLKCSFQPLSSWEILQFKAHTKNTIKGREKKKAQAQTKIFPWKDVSHSVKPIKVEKRAIDWKTPCWKSSKLLKEKLNHLTMFHSGVNCGLLMLNMNKTALHS